MQTRPVDHSDLYIPLARKCSIADELMDFARKLPDSGWGGARGFMASPVPAEIVDADPFLKAIKQEFKTRYGLLCLPPNTCYPWHMDVERGAILNMPLNGHGKSTCVFTRDLKEAEYFEFTRLEYVPQTYYIFNTQVQHMVLNYGERRFLFSFTLLGVKEVPFEQTAKRLLEIEAELEADRLFE